MSVVLERLRTHRYSEAVADCGEEVIAGLEEAGYMVVPWEEAADALRLSRPLTYRALDPNSVTQSDPIWILSMHAHWRSQEIGCPKPETQSSVQQLPHEPFAETNKPSKSDLKNLQQQQSTEKNL